ncbi:hypothetical protein C5167_035500 [Papaver somniferum]|uniref:Uncharacterized protein n=1 Tax=Papaver somniferum TaxID=3469 RepID=A0A4Y7KHF8_PAPSO|nr:hypothetical protein C5167_035500 [Papaver somniferum]
MFPSIVVFQMSVVAEERVASLMIRRSATEKAAGSSKSGCGLNSKNLGSKKFVCSADRTVNFWDLEDGQDQWLMGLQSMTLGTGQSIEGMWIPIMYPLIELHRVGGTPQSFGNKEQKFNVQEGTRKSSTEKHASPHVYEAMEYINIYVDSKSSLL